MESSGALGIPPNRPTRAFPRTAGRCTLQYPVVPLKIGVFQELRDNIVSGQPYQAHGWFISRQNPVMSLPDRGKTLRAFEKMDFIVTVDIVLNDTAWFSDVVLPEASYLERYDPLLPVEIARTCASPSSSRTVKRGRRCGFTSSWANVWGWAIISSMRMKKTTSASSSRRSV